MKPPEIASTETDLYGYGVRRAAQQNCESIRASTMIIPEGDLIQIGLKMLPAHMVKLAEYRAFQEGPHALDWAYIYFANTVALR
jgi:hypothetical protein